jgi:hypothetical protein
MEIGETIVLGLNPFRRFETISPKSNEKIAAVSTHATMLISSA